MKTKKFVAKTNFFHKTIFSNIKSFVETIFIIFWMKFIRKIWQKKSSLSIHVCDDEKNASTTEKKQVECILCQSIDQFNIFKAGITLCDRSALEEFDSICPYRTYNMRLNSVSLSLFHTAIQAVWLWHRIDSQFIGIHENRQMRIFICQTSLFAAWWNTFMNMNIKTWARTSRSIWILGASMWNKQLWHQYILIYIYI